MRKVRTGLSSGLVVLAIVVGSSTHALASAKNYHFGVSDQRTNITFQSETDFETILGSSKKLAGTAVADLEEGKAEISLAVPVASLRTGIDLRDEHLRSPMWLDAEKYPTISFVSSEAKKVSHNRWKIRGTFTLHGVSRELTTTVDVRSIPAALAKEAGLEGGEWIRITAPFKVKLSDFGVRIPGKAAAKVNDTWEVHIQAYASTATAKQAANPCNPCGGKVAVRASNPTNPCN